MTQKKVLKLQKSLREIAALKQRRDRSEPLEKNQVTKIALEEEVQSQLAQLLSQESPSEAANGHGDHGAVNLRKASLADVVAPESAEAVVCSADRASTAPEQVEPAEVSRRARPRGGRSGFRRKYDADH